MVVVVPPGIVVEVVVVDVVVLLVVEVLVVLVVEVDVVDDVVVVDAGTHWLFSQLLPGAQLPQFCGTPQPFSIMPHWALSSAQVCAVQQVPNLSLGFCRTHELLAQLRSTLQNEPPGLPPRASAGWVVVRRMRSVVAASRNMGGLLRLRPPACAPRSAVRGCIGKVPRAMLRAAARANKAGQAMRDSAAGDDGK